MSSTFVYAHGTERKLESGLQKAEKHGEAMVSQRNQQTLGDFVSYRNSGCYIDQGVSRGTQNIELLEEGEFPNIPL